MAADKNDDPFAGSFPDDGNAPPEHLSVVLKRLYESGRGYAEAEVDRQKLRAALAGVTFRDVAILGFVAAVLFFATIVTLMIALLMALAKPLGLFGATAVVAGTALALIALLLLIARNKVRAFIGKMKQHDD